MKLFLKIVKVIAVLLISVTVILFSAALIMQDRVADLVLKSLNKSIATKFEIETVRLSFLRKFPKASLDLKNVLVHSSPGFNKSEFEGVDTDTLLAARSVFVEFDMADIWHGTYNIERIGIRDGLLRLLSDSSGMVNYEISAGSDEGSEGNFTIDLQRISVDGVKAYYSNRAVRLLVEGTIGKGQLKSRISGDEIDFTAVSEMMISSFQLNNTRISNSVPAYIDISLSASDSVTSFSRGSLQIDDYKFTLQGSIYSNGMLDLSLTGENLDIAGLRKYLPEELISKISGYNPAGLMQVNGSIKGLTSRTSMPGISVFFTLNNGSISLPDNPLNFNGITLEGSFANGSGQVPSTSSITVNSFSGSLGSALYSGSLSLNNFDSLNGFIELKGKVIPAELKEFFNIKTISSSSGSFDIRARLDGALPEKEKFSAWDLFDMDPEADITFNNLSIGFKNEQLRLERISGKLAVGDTVTAEDLEFGFRDHRFGFEGVFRNLPGWLAGKPVILAASGKLQCDRLVPELLIPADEVSGSGKNRKKAIVLPDDIILDLDYSIDTIRIKKFRAEKISGTLSCKPGLVNFKSLSLNTLEGFVSGTGFIVRKPDKGFSARGTFDLDNININTAFSAFGNFGQNFIRAENINGKLTGSLSILLPADSLLKIDVKTTSAEGKYIIEDGALVNFEPLKSLSRFIELSELENIRFEKLENDFFIRNNYLYIPQMDVKSSAADLSVNGKHSFDVDYEYHIKMLLSEILSKKYRKPRAGTTEFGAVQDDGLGRTSILLKIENRGDDLKVSYDMKAAGNEIRNDIREERKTLKNILNEEYGWFKADTAVPEKPAAAAPRFKIAWEETDSVEVDIPEEETVKPSENPILNLFRKKKK